MQRGHAEALMGLIDDVLTEAGADYAALTKIGVCTGPGSFTGVRVGVASARGLALGLGIPAIGVSRLEALAATAPPGRVSAVVPMRPGAWARQDFDAERQVQSDPDIADHPEPSPGFTLAADPGDAEAVLAGPVVIARLADAAQDRPRPAPVYLGPAAAAPSKIQPPRMLAP